MTVNTKSDSASFTNSDATKTPGQPQINANIQAGKFSGIFLPKDAF